MRGSDPILTVSDFVAVFNQSLDVMYPGVAIVGELSNFRVSKGMWVYFDLKDELASVRFFGTTRALPGPVEDGMMLEVHGRPYLHPKFGFSVQIDSVQAVGAGSIKKAQNLLAAKLEKEGVFDPSRKRELPFPPATIGLITSSESAAYSDFAKIIAARWPALDIELFDVQVQGADAPTQIVAALEAANQKHDLEVVVLIRGGGSRDDLQAFDHELVVRAVAASRIPTLVAIGHERDVVLSELAADQRASTPSNAAELLVPDRRVELSALKQLKKDLGQHMVEYIHNIRTDLKKSLEVVDEHVRRSFLQSQQQIATVKQLLALLDPKHPLQRGFALVRGADGRMIRSKAQLQKLGAAQLEFGDGEISVKTNKVQ